MINSLIPASSQNPLLNLSLVDFSLTKEKSLFRNVSITVRPGERIAVIGPSGCGKSTLLHILAGLIKVDTSKPNQIIDFHFASDEVSLILQNYGLFPWKSVQENIELGLRLQRGKYKQNSQAVSNVIEKLGISELLKRWPRELSGGQQQRVAIARSLLLSPKLLLLDEPFSSVDTLTREKLQFLLNDLWRQNTFAFIFVTHDIDEAIAVSDRIFVLSQPPTSVFQTVENPCRLWKNHRESKDYSVFFHELRTSLKAVCA